jgi:hypothetical protein
MNIRYRVDLSEAERAQLTALLNAGKHPAHKIKRAQILLAADAGVGDEAIASRCLGWWVDRLPNQTAPCRRQPGTGSERGGTPGGAAQAVRQGDRIAGGDRLLQPTRGA